MQETRVWSQVRKIPWGREWLPTQIFLPGKFLRQKSLVGYSPRDCKELDTTEYQCSPTNHTLEKPPKISPHLREAQSSSFPAKNLPRNKPSSPLGPNLQFLLFPVEKSMSSSDLASNTNANSSSGCPSSTARAGCQVSRKGHLSPNCCVWRFLSRLMYFQWKLPCACSLTLAPLPLLFPAPFRLRPTADHLPHLFLTFRLLTASPCLTWRALARWERYGKGRKAET